MDRALEVWEMERIEVIGSSVQCKLNELGALGESPWEETIGKIRVGCSYVQARRIIREGHWSGKV